MEQASRWQLFNTSWTVHRVSPLHHVKDFETLLNNEAALKTYATRLRDQLTGDVLAGFQSTINTSESDTLSKSGELKDCRWEFFAAGPSQQRGVPPKASFPGILVTLEYENATYKAALLADTDSTTQPRKGVTALPLLLTKVPIALRQTFINFMYSNFDTYCSTLGLSSRFLCEALENFVSVVPGSEVEDVIKELQLTLSFSSSIAPALRNINVGVPRASLVSFLDQDAANSKGKAVQGKAKIPLVENITSYLETHLAMKLDLDGSHHNGVARQHVRLSKVACAAFVISSDGRLKLIVDAKRAGENADEEEDTGDQNISSLRANERLLRAVIRKSFAGEQVTT